jgi:hypothetical protein
MVPGWDDENYAEDHGAKSLRWESRMRSRESTRVLVFSPSYPARRLDGRQSACVAQQDDRRDLVAGYASRCRSGQSARGRAIAFASVDPRYVIRIAGVGFIAHVRAYIAKLAATYRPARSKDRPLA